MNPSVLPCANGENLLEEYNLAKTALLEHSLYIAGLVVDGTPVNEAVKDRFRRLKTSVSVTWDVYQADEARYRSKEAV
jgi:hypothetical protein